MMKRPTGSPQKRERRWWPTPSLALAGAAVFLALGGSAVAANALIQAGDIAPGAVTSSAIRNGAIGTQDLSASARDSLESGPGNRGAKGETGASGAPGSNGANGPSGANGVEGPKGSNGANGANGPNGANGVDGGDGADGDDGIDGLDGTNGIDGTAGTDGTDGTIAPFSASKGLTTLLTASPPTTVVELAVPAGNYVVLAKTQLSHTGAGDSVECTLKSGTATIDQIAMKTLPALAAIPASLQAVTTATATPTQLSVQCKVLVAGGEANFSSLIAIPTA